MKNKESKEKKSLEIREREQKLIMEQEDSNVRKVESLMRLLEAYEPYEPDAAQTNSLSDKTYVRSILDEKNKDRIILKIFELIKKY